MLTAARGLRSEAHSRSTWRHCIARIVGCVCVDFETWLLLPVRQAPTVSRQSRVESQKQIATEPRNGTKVQKTIWYFMRDFKLILTKLNWMHSCWWIVLHDSGLWHYTDTYICVCVYTPYWNFVASDHNRRVPVRSLRIYAISLCMKMHNRHAHTHRETNIYRDSCTSIS